MLQAYLHNAPVGVTAHFMTPELDAGNIVAQQSVNVPKNASVFEGSAHLFRAGADLLVEVLNNWEKGLVGKPQVKSGSYESWPSRREVKGLRVQGRALIRIADFVRFKRLIKRIT